MCKVSVIVPVYNVEDYIDKCLNSLVSQTLKDIEIIVVNDGSTDNSQSIIEKFAKKYPKKVKSFIKENGGQGSARNYGFSVASGEYVGFVDSDDFVDKNMFLEMYEKGSKNNSDIVLCGIKYIYPDKVEEVLPLNKKKITIKNCILTAPAIWNKIYKREYLVKENFAFDKKIIYEDLALIPYLYINASNISYINKPFYSYYIRVNSTMNYVKYNPKTNDIFDACNKLYERLSKYPEYNNELETLFIEHLLYNASFRFYQFDESKSNIYKISDIMKEKFPNWRKNSVVKKYSKKDRFILELFYRKKIGVLDFLIKIKKWSKHEKN